MTLDQNSPIGIFDSGAGGVSVLLTAVRMLPEESYIYFGDSANAPYGTKTKDEVLLLARNVVDRLMRLGVKAIVIACNTATADAAKELRELYDLPIIGMEPALKPAASIRRDGQVLVLATPGTLRSEKYARLYAKYGAHAVSLPCPGLMEFVERGEMDTPALHEYLGHIFASFDPESVDAVVLGCTHYVFLRRAVAAHFTASTAIIDGNEGTIRQLQNVLNTRGLSANGNRKGTVTLYSSGDQASLGVLQNLFKENIEL